MRGPYDGSTKKDFFGEKTRQDIWFFRCHSSCYGGSEESKNLKKKLGKRLQKSKISG
jgi:hypothetical protein